MTVMIYMFSRRISGGGERGRERKRKERKREREREKEKSDKTWANTSVYFYFIFSQNVLLDDDTDASNEHSSD
jgi:hypothetical protein